MRTHVGQYRIEAPLGRGGMGVVYRGVHEHLGRPVAIKALAPELTQQPEFKERFFSEAKTQARLQHPNIIGVYDLLEDGGEYFIVMEFVEGHGLDDLLKSCAGRGMELGEAVSVFGQVLAALDYAHSQGIIHRDIKPSNVMVTVEGRVKLVDFGIALLIGDKRLTASQSAIGTPTYMSPEQILRPRSVDHRSDIYSAAVVFYEMLAGRPPFDAETEYEIKKQHVEVAPPDLSTLAPGLPPGAVEAISCALSKDPNGRFPSAGAFLRTLQEAVPAGLMAAVPPPLPIYRPTTIEPVPGTGTPGAGTPRGAQPLQAARRGGLLEGKTKWVVLGAAAVLAVGFGLGGFLLLRPAGGGAGAGQSATASDTAPPVAVAAVPPGTAGLPPPPGGQPLVNIEQPSGLSAAPGGASPGAPAALASSAVDPRTTAPPPRTERPMVDKPATRRQAAAAPTATAIAAAEPPPAAASAPSAAPVSEAQPAASGAAMDQFNLMNDLIVNVERLSGQALKAHEESGGEDDPMWERLEAFVEAAKGTRKEFRKATGTGIAGIKESVTSVFRRNRGGREGDTKVLQVRVEDLMRRADDVDSLNGSTPMSATAREYWKEARQNLTRLAGLFR